MRLSLPPTMEIGVRVIISLLVVLDGVWILFRLFWKQLKKLVLANWNVFITRSDLYYHFIVYTQTTSSSRQLKMGVWILLFHEIYTKSLSIAQN